MSTDIIVPKGLLVYHNVFDETNIKQFLEAQTFESLTEAANSRGVLQYGHPYNYRHGSREISVNPIPDAITTLTNDFLCATGLTVPYNSCIVNRYTGNQGISAHRDSTIFGPCIMCFVIGSGAELEFAHPEGIKFTTYLKGGDVYLMSGESRYVWTHEIRKRTSDVVDGERIPRGTRYSVTLREKL